MRENTIEKFWKTLEDQGWVFYVPKPVWEARTAGLLPEVKINLPLWSSRSPEEERLLESFSLDFPGMWTNTSILPVPNFTAREEWNALLSRLGLQGKQNGYVSNKGWVYHVRFLRILIGQDDNHEEWRNRNRRLRKEFGLPASDAIRNKKFRSQLLLNVKTYPPEQMKKARKRVEDFLRKADTAEICRAAKFLGLLS